MELGVSSEAIIAKSKSEGLGEEITNPNSVVSPGRAETIKAWFADVGNVGITKEVADSRFPSQSDGVRSELQFSKNAHAVLYEARSLAQKSGRPGITSSCLLFAFAECASSSSNTTRFLRATLERYNNYPKSFNAFLKSAPDLNAQGTISLIGFDGVVSSDLHPTFENARNIAISVSSEPVICARHLLAALLAGRLPYAWATLKDLGVELNSLIREFRASLKTIPRDNQDAWDSVLGTDATVAYDASPPAIGAAPPSVSSPNTRAEADSVRACVRTLHFE